MSSQTKINEIDNDIQRVKQEISEIEIKLQFKKEVLKEYEKALNAAKSQLSTLYCIQCTSTDNSNNNITVGAWSTREKAEFFLPPGNIYMCELMFKESLTRDVCPFVVGIKYTCRVIELPKEKVDPLTLNHIDIYDGENRYDMAVLYEYFRHGRKQYYQR